MVPGGVTVSVVIPTWNRVGVIGRALDSVCAQTRPADEIIVADDGSDDQTLDWVHNVYPHVTCLELPHRGVSAARNTASRAASGDWLAFLDSDDEWKPQKLERQLEAARANTAYRVFHCEEIWIRNGVRVNPMAKHAKPEGWIFEHCLPLCCVSPSTVLIDRGVFLESGGFDESLPACEDYDLWLRLFLHNPIHKLNDPLVIRYGGHEDQLSARHWGMDRFRVVSLVRLLETENLSLDQRALVTRTLAGKLDILINGALKRNQGDSVAHYRALRDKWIQVVS